MKTQIERMLAEAKRRYNDAAAMHSMGKVSYEGGKVDALKEVLKLLG